MFLVEQMASGVVFMFCAPELIFGGNEGAGSRFLVLRSRSHFPRYRGRRVPFSCFAHPNSFSVVHRASCPIFMFCAPGHVFGGTEGVESRFHVLRARTHFHGYRGRWVPFSCFALSTRFRRFQVRRVPFSCFACPDSFSTVLKASAPVSFFARPDWFSMVLRVSGPVFMFCVPRLVFDVIEGVWCRFQVLLSRTCFRRCRVRRVTFSCFAHPDRFSAERIASGQVFFCVLRLIFGGTEGAGRYQGLRVQFSCFARPDSF
jgi:hypothetical protein